MKFADAEQSYEESDYIIFGVPYEDVEMSFRAGSKEAPDFVRYISWDYESYSIAQGIDLQDVAIHDAGDMEIKEAVKFIKKIYNDKKKIEINRFYILKLSIGI